LPVSPKTDNLTIQGVTTMSIINSFTSIH